MDTQGVEDPKLFVWPGKGVYAVFGRKPEALGASPYCKDPIFVQFLVQVGVGSVRVCGFVWMDARGAAWRHACKLLGYWQARGRNMEAAKISVKSWLGLAVGSCKCQAGALPV